MSQVFLFQLNKNLSRLINCKLAIVTGGGAGIGRAVCNALAKKDISVVVADVKKDAAQETVDAINSISKGHRAIEVDVKSSKSVEELFRNVSTAYNKPANILVNCAGITRDSLLVEMTEKAFDEVINVNLKGTFLMTKIACKEMIEHKISDGSIVNISSISGKMGNFGQANYAASKAAIEAFTRTTAKEVAKHNIRCNAVRPGFISTTILDTMPQKVIDMLRSQIPMKREGRPEEVAELIMFLALPLSSYITGATIQISGGLAM